MLTTIPLYHSTTLPLYHSTTLPLYHSTTLPLYHSTTTLHSTPLTLHSTTLSLYHSTTLPLYHSTTLPLYHSTTLPLYHSTTLPLYHSTITSHIPPSPPLPSTLHSTLYPLPLLSPSSPLFTTLPLYPVNSFRILKQHVHHCVIVMTNDIIAIYLEQIISYIFYK